MKPSIRMLTRAALMTALICVLSQISIPIGVTPLTLQTFALALAGYFLGAGSAFWCVACYLLLGACGLPVFSGFGGGLGHLVGPTGGFLVGFPFMALLCGCAKKCGMPLRIAAGLGGILVVYIFGALWLQNATQMPLMDAIAVGVLPFVWKDAGSVLVAALLEKKLSTRLGGVMKGSRSI